MSNLEQLLKLGAEIVGGSLIWKHKELGVLRNGEFHISEHGKAALNVEDAVVKEVKPRKTKAVEEKTAESASVKNYEAGDNLEIDLEP